MLVHVSLPAPTDAGASRHCPRRTANRPGSQRMARHKSTDFLQSATAGRHAADGDRPRSGGNIEMRRNFEPCIFELLLDSAGAWIRAPPPGHAPRTARNSFRRAHPAATAPGGLKSALRRARPTRAYTMILWAGSPERAGRVRCPGI